MRTAAFDELSAFGLIRRGGLLWGRSATFGTLAKPTDRVAATYRCVAAQIEYAGQYGQLGNAIVIGILVTQPPKGLQCPTRVVTLQRAQDIGCAASHPAGQQKYRVEC